MSYQVIQKIPIKPNVPRDFQRSLPLSTSQKIDLFQQWGVMGLDIFIHNMGASSLTIAIDKQPAITVEAGDCMSWGNIKYSLVEVTSAVAYDFVVTGVHLSKELLKKHGITV